MSGNEALQQPLTSNNGISSNDNETEDTGSGEGPSDAEDRSGSLLSELLYCISSFHAVFTPVSITMILSALAVININTDETRAQGEAVYSQTYQVFDLEDGNSTQNLLASLANVLIIVSVICVMTFVIVILYKYGCTKIFLGYMVVVTTMLLGYFTSNMALVAIEKYELRIDKFSFAYVIWNYAIVGILAIFYNHGIPKVVTQGYLVTSSVVLAWQLSYFNDWTAWTLLVMLALYDLFAVLSPYGPLKALTNLMSRPGAQPLPGLLYEASLPSGVARPGTNNNDNSGGNNDENSAAYGQGRTGNEAEPMDNGSDAQAIHPNNSPEVTSSTFINENLPDDEKQNSNTINFPVFFSSNNEEPDSRTPRDRTRIAGQANYHSSENERRPVSMNTSQESIEPQLPQSTRPEERQGVVALAIAKLYKLQVVDEEGVLSQRGRRRVSDYQREYSPEEVRSMEWTAKQLRTAVTVVFPARGGRIVMEEEQNRNEGPRYLVYSRHETLLRTFIVNKEGKVLQVVKKEQIQSSEPNTIKLGLGDFIFYSVLVSKAAQASFTAFAGCMLTILFGLGATLVLLAVHNKALPALPISIFLAVGALS